MKALRLFLLLGLLAPASLFAGQEDGKLLKTWGDEQGEATKELKVSGIETDFEKLQEVVLFESGDFALMPTDEESQSKLFTALSSDLPVMIKTTAQGLINLVILGQPRKSTP